MPLDTTKKLRDDLPNPHETIIDAEIWHQDSHELQDLAETLINRHPRFAWLVVEAWLTKHNQVLVDKS
jgi:hypothetical protein